MTGTNGARQLEPRLSIYFPPFRDPSAFCEELDFARRSRWADFLGAYLSQGQ